MGLFETASRKAQSRAEELSHDEDYTASPKSQDTTANRPYAFSGGSGPDRTDPPKDEITRYWRLFETVPIVRQPITSFASQVIEPGYYIDHDGLDEEIIHDLTHWLETSSIIEGEVGKDFRKLLKKAVIQREVKGSGLVEKVYAEEDDDALAGLKLIKVETVEAHTRPGQAILLSPEDTQYDDVPKTDDGDAAAYVQTITSSRFGGNDTAKFTSKDIIKLTRDGDAGDIFGTSRLESSADRIDGLLQKLDDNDQAIESKAYPLWLFKFGTEDSPWEGDDIDSFMRAHEMENFHPGMKQGVRGDVSVDTVSGEVADISGFLNFDINWIITSMPMPKYALGGFEDSVGQVAGAAQQSDVNRQIREAREEIQSEFTPVLRQKAEQMGVSEEDAERLELIIGKPDQPDTEPDNEQVIRYLGVDNEQPQGGDGGDGLPEDNPSTDDSNLPPDTDAVRTPESGEASDSVWDSNIIAELSRPSHDALAEAVYDRLKKVRDNSLDEAGREFSQSPMLVASNFERIANTEINRAFRNGDFENEINTSVKDAMNSALTAYDYQPQWSMQRSSNVSYYASNVENATRDAMDELSRRIRLQLRRAAEDTEAFDNARQRVENSYSDAKLRQRANIIAMNELHNIQETTKLQEFEQDSNVVGVRLTSDNPTTNLCQSLDGKEFYFSDGPIGQQLQESVNERQLQDGFDPIPSTPPFHFGCKKRMEPIYR